VAYSIPHHATNSGSSTSVSVTITSPASGNLLVVELFCLNVAGMPAAPSGWTIQANDTAGTEKQASYWKVSNGTETTFSVTLAVTSPWSCSYLEVAGFVGTITLDQWSWADSGSTSVSHKGVGSQAHRVP